ncbi:GDSL-type esterase/lipase family protein [Halocatena salina]|uniref:GDSL-type esterase/lipase family protein n=1 Tax=Halocatena salina TaxID=2934340 RepID=A0A8U0A5G4_9EURY|nr:GDSL-type esterase/lipase family protein [Halocatena salina]UPM44274.1 GDSL-type esterase/lipase family protein [Halocatena salina]
MRRDRLEFHNVGECRAVEEGVVLQRVPERVRTALNEGAQTRMVHPAGVELRFVPDDSVSVTLSTNPTDRATESIVRVFWGSIQSTETFVIGPEPTTIELSIPEPLTDIRPEKREPLAYDPHVCRLVLPGEHRGAHVCYHGVEGDRRPPTEAELPDQRYLAYGTSITEGEAAVAEHLTYVNQTARRLGVDPINLGSCGTAYCDRAMADHIAARDDWDIATLALSVNMVDRFSVEEFRERTTYMIDRIAAANPDATIACITIYPNARDVRMSVDGERCEQFRQALRDTVADIDNVSLFEGPEILPDIGGLTTDLVHPGDNAMIRMSENLADTLEAVR